MADLEPDLEKAIHRVTRRGQFILGPEVARLERGFARFCRCRFGVGVASGTDALELALRAAGVGPGDWVVTVSFTFVATVDAIRHVGGRPLFVDIDPSTFTLDPQDLEDRLSRLRAKTLAKVKGILPVHLFGHPCDMDALTRIAQRYRLAIIEDAAQAVGAQWKGQPVGSLGEAGCFSFFPSKSLGAFGDGGICVTNSAPLARRLRRLRVHGRQEDGRQVDLGRNSRLDELQAAILNVKLRQLPHGLRERQGLSRLYSERLSRIPQIQCPVVASYATHAFCLYVIRVKNRDAVKEFLRRRGITTQVYYSVPVHRQPVYGQTYREVSLPETERAAEEVLALPFFPGIRPAELDRVCRAIAEFMRK